MTQKKNFNGHGKHKRTIPTRYLPEGSKRITKPDGERVWLINGKEYVSKAEYFQYLQDQKIMADIQSMADEKKKTVVKDVEHPVPDSLDGTQHTNGAISASIPENK